MVGILLPRVRQGVLQGQERGEGGRCEREVPLAVGSRRQSMGRAERDPCRLDRLLKKVDRQFGGMLRLLLEVVLVAQRVSHCFAHGGAQKLGLPNQPEHPRRFLHQPSGGRRGGGCETWKRKAT
jgi:hypothetical protein